MCGEPEQIKLKTHEEIVAKIEELLAYHREAPLDLSTRSWYIVGVQSLEWVLGSRANLLDS